MNITVKIILIAVAVFLVYWRFSRRWKKASDYSDQMAKDHEKEKGWYESTKTDPRFLQLLQEVNGRFKTSFQKTDDSETYKIDYAAFYNAKMQAVAPSDPAAAYVCIYLRGKDKLILSKDLKTDKVTEQKVNGFTYDASLPLWTKL